MNIKEATLLAAQLRHDLPTLDLHGLYPHQALEKLELFLYTIFQSGERAARVVYGVGTGKLQATVVPYLREHPLVQDVVEEGPSALLLFNL